MKVEVIAKQGFGTTKKGGRVRVPRDHAAVLVKMGLAEYAPVKAVEAKPKPPTTLTVKPAAPKYSAKVMTEAKAAESTAPVPGMYSRRDLRVED